jgi:hypothetical protein
LYIANARNLNCLLSLQSEGPPRLAFAASCWSRGRDAQFRVQSLQKANKNHRAKGAKWDWLNSWQFVDVDNVLME